MGFRENLKSEMEFADVTVKELAYRSGVNQKTLESYLAPRPNTPSVNAAYKIAKALNVSVEYLVTGKEDYVRRPLSSLPADVQEIVRTLERLHEKDRAVVLTLAGALRGR